MSCLQVASFGFAQVLVCFAGTRISCAKSSAGTSLLPSMFDFTIPGIPDA